MTTIQSAMLWSDWIIYALFIIAIICFFWMRRQVHLREPWLRVAHRRLSMVALVILLFFVGAGLLDSIHLRITTYNNAGKIEKTHIKSLFDTLISPLGQQEERSYSAPFATHLFSQSLVTLPDGKEVRSYPRLLFGGAYLKNPQQEKTQDIILKSITSFLAGLISFIALVILLLWLLSHKNKQAFFTYFVQVFEGKTYIAWRGCTPSLYCHS